MISKKIQWVQTEHQSSNNSIDRFFGKVNNILFFDIYKFKNDQYVMSINIPGTKNRINKNKDLEVLKEEAEKEFSEFLLNLTIPDIKEDIYVFLDIDGVVCTRKSLDDAWENYSGELPAEGFSENLKIKKLTFPGFSMDNWPFDPECIKNIYRYQRLFNKQGYNVKYVISSSWRTGRTVEELNDLFILKGLCLSTIIDKTANSKERIRGNEINIWLKENNALDKPFIVIDDECSDINDYIKKEHIINTTFDTGFDYSKYKEAVYKTLNLLK